MVVADFSSVFDTVGTIVALLIGLGVLTFIFQTALAFWQERKRTQPIVLTHEDRERHFDSRGGTSAWVVHAHIENVGLGPAFNVRFGVEFNGIRFPYRLEAHDPETGNRQTVLRPGGRLPEAGGSFPILLSSQQMFGSAMKGKEGELDAKRVYWARFENASGRLWETRNPGDRSSDLNIRALSKIWQRRRSNKENKERRQALELSADAEASLLADLNKRQRRSRQ